MEENNTNNFTSNNNFKYQSNKYSSSSNTLNERPKFFSNKPHINDTANITNSQDAKTNKYNYQRDPM